MSAVLVSRLRLISGLVLFAFILGHFINHTLGIVSLGAMNGALKYSILPWRSLPGEILFFSSLIIHAALAVWAIYERQNWQLKSWEIIQLVSGFAIPILMAAHVIASRGVYENFGLEVDYAFILYSQWVALPIEGIKAFAGLILVWTHACIGWHYWLRYYQWYDRLKLFLFILAILIPTLAIVGAISAGFRVLRLSRSDKWVDRVLGQLKGQEKEVFSFIQFLENAIYIGLAIAIGFTLIVQIFRWFKKRLARGTVLKYRDIKTGNRRELKIAPGQTLLEQLREKGIPHASVCGGRGRCSTCRVRIDGGGKDLPIAEANEKRVLSQIGAEDNIRLACQIRPLSDISVTALLRSDVSAREAFSINRSKAGEEQEIAVLFADIRAFTKLSESQLPFDTAFLLNRYFAAMGAAIEASGGHLDKFIGDGVMALFGVDQSLEAGCKKALLAASKMSHELEVLNDSLKEELKEPLRIGIGIHSGTAIVGNLGYKHASGLTAIGDVVNTASRLESMTKEHQVQLIVSQKTIEKSGFDTDGGLAERISIRGRDEPLAVVKYQSAKNLGLLEIAKP